VILKFALFVLINLDLPRFLITYLLTIKDL